MKLLKEKTRYLDEEVSSGGRVSIESDDQLAVAAMPRLPPFSDL
jgi:hypothetical protein